MTEISSSWRSLLVLFTLAGGLALAGGTVGPAHAQGVSQENLVAHGWVCVPFAPANRLSCFPPGTGRPFPGNPDPRPSYDFVAFDQTSGEFIYTGHLVRGDIYAGQACAPGNDPYVYRALIDYYECVHA